MIYSINAKSVRLCCKGKGLGCPVISEEDDSEYITITDDFGNKIKIRKEEARLVSDAVKVIDEKKLILG